MKYSIPRYLKIAVSICESIISDEYQEGTKLKGLSVMATKYGVSQETVRRSLNLLSDKGIINIANGKSSIVISKDQAKAFIISFDKNSIIQQMQLSLVEAHRRRDEIDKEIDSITDQLVYMHKHKVSDKLEPFEIEIDSQSHMINRSIGDLEIWHNTGATILGIVREEETIVSPGPYFEFKAKDKVIIVGDKYIVERFNSFMKGLS
ncbi:MAG: TrkA C-terminal domain-containing protein [Clostridia bacterium]|nr:TrkA C-terminal domain-containing protein [Clostridia bacterium]